MSVRTQLKLISPEARPHRAPEADGPFRFERRQHDRWSVTGVATAIGLGGGEFGRRYVLRLSDFSDAGLGATCDRVMTPGTSVVVAFQAPGLRHKQGVVARCLPCGDGYRVAIVFERRLAA